MRIDIKGKGSINFVSENGSKRVLTDVYYIPELRSNIISLGQATEAGCEVRMKDNYLILHDKDGNLITKASRARNRLYKVTMNTVDAKCFQVQQESEYTRWHARLGHIGMDSMKAMIRKELVEGMPHINVEKETCESCLLGKQVSQGFPKATQYGASQVLKLIHYLNSFTAIFADPIHLPLRQRIAIYSY